MEKVIICLEEQVDFWGVGLILDATNDRNEEQMILEKWWGKILLQKVA